MRIGLMGVSACGKTTLALYLTHNKIVDVSFLPSCARKIAAEHGFQSNEDFMNASVGDVYACQDRMFTYRMEQEQYLKEFVSDRTLLDIFIHTIFRCPSMVSEFMYKTYQRQVYTSLKTYDYLFYLESPPIIKDDDPLRITDQSIIYVLQILYYDYIIMFNNKAVQGKNKPIYYLPWDTLENRVEKVQAILGDQEEK
jgi:hypothetical protein